MSWKRKSLDSLASLQRRSIFHTTFPLPTEPPLIGDETSVIEFNLIRKFRHALRNRLNDLPSLFSLLSCSLRRLTMLRLRPSGLSAMDVASPVLHGWVYTKPISLFALRPALRMQRKSFACFHHELTAVSHVRPPTFPITACPLI